MKLKKVYKISNKNLNNLFIEKSALKKSKTYNEYKV